MLPCDLMSEKTPALPMLACLIHIYFNEKNPQIDLICRSSTLVSFFKLINPFTATGYFDIPPPRWPTFLAMLFHILKLRKEGMGLSLLDELEVQYHVIKK